ncbi:MAG: nuclear transport factor 2 family protein [Acidobacteria bacterium]|nr:nuclear transport factor 2 family protein [Acidobacteriota bacterium]
MAVGDDLEAIRVLKARYFRFVDTKQWDEWRALFTDDVAVDLGETGTFDDADTFVAFVRQALEAATTVHHGHMPEIELTGADEATGVWAMADIVLRPGAPRVMGYGHYHETYRRVDGQWRIASMRLTRLLVDVQ